MVDPIRLEPFKLTGSLSRPSAANEGTSPPFTDVLKDSMTRVNDLQVQSDKIVQRLALGEVEDISEVSIAVEKAELALRMMVQIRDKLLDAYQQISRMSS